MPSPSYQLLQGDPTTWGVPPLGSTFIGVNGAGQIVTKQNNGTITALTTSSPAAAQVASAAGTVTITPTQPIFAFELDLGGGARGVPIVLDHTGAVEGAQLEVTVVLPSTIGLAMTFRDANSGGTILAQYTSDGAVLSYFAKFVFRGGAWNIVTAYNPAY